MNESLNIDVHIKLKKAMSDLDRFTSKLKGTGKLGASGGMFKGLNGSFSKLSGMFGKIGGGITKLLPSVAGFGAAFLAIAAPIGIAVGAFIAVGAAVTGLIIPLAKLSKQAMITERIFNATFAGMSDTANAEVKRLASELSMGTQAVKKYLGDITDQYASLGLGTATSMELAATSIEQAEKLARFRGVSMAEALSAITKATNGENESLKRFGVNIKATDKEYQKLIKNIMETEHVTEKQAKAMAVSIEVAKQSKNAFNSFDSSKGAWDVKLREANQILQDMTVGLFGDVSTQIMDTVIGYYSDLVKATKEWIDDNYVLVETIKNFMSILVTVIDYIMKGLGWIIRIAWDIASLVSNIVGVLLGTQSEGELLGWIIDGLNYAWEYLGKFVAELAIWFIELGPKIGKSLLSMFQYVMKYFHGMIKSIPIVGWISSIMQGITNTVINGIKGLFDYVISLYEWLKKFLGIKKAAEEQIKMPKDSDYNIKVKGPTVGKDWQKQYNDKIVKPNHQKLVENEKNERSLERQKKASKELADIEKKIAFDKLADNEKLKQYQKQYNDLNKKYLDAKKNGNNEEAVKYLKDREQVNKKLLVIQRKTNKAKEKLNSTHNKKLIKETKKNAKVMAKVMKNQKMVTATQGIQFGSSEAFNLGNTVITNDANKQIKDNTKETAKNTKDLVVILKRQQTVGSTGYETVDAFA